MTARDITQAAQHARLARLLDARIRELEMFVVWYRAWRRGAIVTIRTPSQRAAYRDDERESLVELRALRTLRRTAARVPAEHPSTIAFSSAYWAASARGERAPGEWVEEWGK